MAKRKPNKTAVGLLMDAFHRVVSGDRPNEVGCNQLAPSGAKYFLPPECLNSISRASEILIDQCDGFPVEQLAKDLANAVITARDRNESAQAAHGALGNYVSQTLATFQKQTSWRAVIAVSGLDHSILPRTVGTVAFRVMDDRTFTETGKQLSAGSAEPPEHVAVWDEWEQDKLEIRNRVVAFVDVEARDQCHAKAKAYRSIRNAINAMRLVQIAGPCGHRPYPAIGVSDEPDRDERSLVFRLGRPAVGMQRALKGLGVVFGPTLTQSPLLEAVSQMLSVESEARTEMHKRIITLLTWVGIAVEVESRPVQLISLVTALETLLIQKHESKGKTGRLASRIAHLYGNSDAERQKSSEEWVQMAILRNRCVHDGLEDCKEVHVKKIAKVAGRVVEVLLTEEKYRGCKTLKDVVEVLGDTDGTGVPGRVEWIRHNAYFRWINMGCCDGNSLQHWIDAEQEYAQTVAMLGSR